MLPLPMNEYLQQGAAECYFTSSSTSSSGIRCHQLAPGAKTRANGANATNVTYAAMDPFFAWCASCSREWRRRLEAIWGFINNPNSMNWKKARQTFDPAARDAALAELTRPRSTTQPSSTSRTTSAARHEPEGEGFVQPKSWFVDSRPVTIAP